jgi:hypothetical protein
MRNLVFVATTALLLSACGSEPDDDNASAKAESYSMETEGGGMKATVTTEDGTATVRSGPGTKPNLPDGFTIYPGSTIVSTANVSQNGEDGSMTMFETSDSADKVIDFYRKQAEAAGFKIESEATVNDAKMIGGEGADKSSFMLNVTPAEGKTTAQLVVGKPSGE